jgi:hypothetical protein
MSDEEYERAERDKEELRRLEQSADLGAKCAKLRHLLLQRVDQLIAETLGQVRLAIKDPSKGSCFFNPHDANDVKFLTSIARTAALAGPTALLTILHGCLIGCQARDDKAAAAVLVCILNGLASMFFGPATAQLRLDELPPIRPGDLAEPESGEDISSGDQQGGHE